MSVSINNLFNYSRSLPVPFDTMTNKKVKVASMYGAKTESTLCGSVIKAVHAMCRCMNGTGEGAVGQIDTNKSVAEYKSSIGPDAYHLVVFDAASGSALASVYDKNTELIEQYVAHPSQRDGAAIFFALMPFLMSDVEFDETFQEYYDQFIAGYPDMAKATESMAILCDNAYRRIKDDTCPAHINITVDKSGNLMRVSQGQLDSGSFVPTSVTAGEFTIFAKTGPAVIKKAGVVVEHTDFVGKYPLTPGRTLSALEQSLIPKLPEWYIIPPEVVDICKHAQKTTGRPMQMRNFLLRGPAGTGKTMGAKAIAAGLGLPYMKYTCSANTEIFDFTGMIFPETDAVSTGSPELDREREILKSMGGISYANVAKLMRFPDLDDMDYDPAGVYQALTGVENLAATVQDCMSVVLEKVTEKVQALSERAETRQSSGQNYTYVETDFVKALKHGYLVEVQEPSTIIQPGVLVGLMWRWIFDGNYGVLNDILMKLGITKSEIAFLAQPQTAFPSAIFTEVWRGIPFFALMMLAGLQAVPHELYEAAKIDGASAVQRFTYITLPSVKNTILVTTMLRLIWVSNAVDLMLNLTGGGPAYSSQTLSVYIFNKAQNMNFGYSSAMAVVLTLCLLVVAIPYVRGMLKEEK